MSAREFHNINQPDGTGVTSSNSGAYGDTPLDFLAITGMVAAYWQGAAGSSAVQFTGGESTSATAVLGWSGLNATTLNKSLAFYMTALPTVTTQIAQIRVGATNTSNISIQPNGRFFVAAPGESYSMTTVLAINTWYRIDWVSTISTTAGINRVVLSPIASNTALEDRNSTTLNTGSSAITDFRWGKLASSGVLPNFFIRDVRTNDATTAPMGVYSGPTTSGPTVDAGSPVSTNVNTAVSLYGTATGAVNITSMTWTYTTYPSGGAPTITGGSSAPNAKSAALTASSTPTVVGTYVYTLAAVDVNGLSGTDTKTVTVTNAPPPALGSTADADFGQAVITVLGTGGVPPYTYSISPVPDDLSKPVPNVYIFAQLSGSATYTFTINDSAGQTTTRTAVVPAMSTGSVITETVLYTNGQWV